MGMTLTAKELQHVKAGPPLPDYIISERAQKIISKVAEVHVNVEPRSGREICESEHRLSTSAENAPVAEDSSSDDDDFGPALPKPAEIEQEEAAARQRLAKVAYSESQSSAPNSSRSKREEWMTVPPTEQDWARSRADPTQIKNKKFLSGPSATTGKRGADRTWSETESERKKRVAEEMMGLRQRANDEPKPATRVEVRDTELDTRVQEFNARNRGKSLLELHREGLANSGVSSREPDDPSKRAFDYEKDIASGGRVLTSSKIDELSQRAEGMNSRFSKGKYM
ncbi:uncharacterized protein V1516DRAFT_670385 [Lipomyces oligophaga]|uniref:uncharacterized protein n=1 Tax=Lipomyces oligophaga TaxID=45792 RepID=UPI0034CF50D9